MPYYRVIYGGYIEGEYDSAEKAKDDFIESIEDNLDTICVEEFDEEAEEWK